jgi:hypothetical protein
VFLQRLEPTFPVSKTTEASAQARSQQSTTTGERYVPISKAIATSASDRKLSSKAMVSKRGDSRQNRAPRKMEHQSRDNDQVGRATRQRGARNHHATAQEQHAASLTRDHAPAHLTREKLPTSQLQHNPPAPAAIQRRRSAEANRLSILAATRCKPQRAERGPLLAKARRE